MPVNLIIRPQDAPLSWGEFVSRWGPFSIAIDGYVADRPILDPRLPAANFNHHENVSRLETRATCAQVHIEIQLGLFQLFRNRRGPNVDVYANDCDEDVCLTWYLLNHGWIAQSIINPRLNKLVDLVDRLDTTAGMFPFPIDMPALTELAWVFEPYRRFRVGGGLERRDPAAFLDIVFSVEKRIESFVIGSNHSLPIDVRYETVKHGAGWVMIEEIGPYGRQGALADGIRAYIVVRKRADGKWAYSVGRVSEFIPFPVLEILKALNDQEGEGPDHWGGGTTIGGSPRSTGSCLSPDQVFEIVEREVEKFVNPEKATA